VPPGEYTLPSSGLPSAAAGAQALFSRTMTSTSQPSTWSRDSILSTDLR
jgi:hypothetical protein